MGKRKILGKENDYGDISRFVGGAVYRVHIFIIAVEALPKQQNKHTIKVDYGYDSALVRGELRKDDEGCYEHVSALEGFTMAVRVREIDGFNKVVTAVKERLSLPEKDDVELSYQWPQWMMGLDWKRANPIYILDDEDMTLFMAIRADLEEVEQASTEAEFEAFKRTYVAEMWRDVCTTERTLEGQQMETVLANEGTKTTRTLNCGVTMSQQTPVEDENLADTCWRIHGNTTNHNLNNVIIRLFVWNTEFPFYQS
ncbi:hypothetical protein ISN45_At05g026070 [Arabidopsis thaliana x Arabidopsis arenosa]|uniref:Uncharacterized protein n=1 Tax=Arabidopsis thaliana x Arabidopsis arenosa TaxID=1240361 RepID=A0A8T2D0Z1_9BRAS|nr:hypothetical protein ISN45_At05g026070 [Arabidopsis thaliana x Arabidopsis arenosa]